MQNVISDTDIPGEAIPRPGVTEDDVKKYIRPNILALEPYSTARDDFKGKADIFLDANENPFPNGYNRYPDPRQRLLKSRIAAIKGVREEQIFIGNGSDEAIDLCYRIFCTPGKSNAVMIAPSYGMYSVAAQINDVAVRKVQLGENFSLPKDKLVSSADSDTRLIFICSPNNPTGNAFSLDEIIHVVEHFDGMVVVDEAYADFSAKGSMLGYIEKYPNLIVLQTLSKAYGMAGLRVGLAFSNPLVMDYFSKVKYPYNINCTAMETALRLLESDIRSQMEIISSQREAVASQLLSCPCVRKVWPSDANFLLVEFDDPSGLYSRLMENGVIVRDRSSVRGCEGCLRITVGTPSENEKLVGIIKDFGGKQR